MTTQDQVLEHWERLRSTRDTTHSDECWKWHPVCAMRIISKEQPCASTQPA